MVYNNIRMRKKIIFGVVVIVAFLGLRLSSMPIANAGSCEGVSTALIDCGDDENGIGHILSFAINVLSVLVGILGVIGVAIAGAQYLSAKDSEEQVRKAKRRIFEIVVGLALYALMAVIAQWLLPGGSLNPSTLPHYEMPEDGGGNAGGGGSGSTVSYDATYELKKYNHPNGTSFDYLLNVPDNATNGMPLVVFLHGDGQMGNAEELKKTNEVEYMATPSSSFISIAPVGKGNDWSSNATQIALKGLIDRTVGSYWVDPNKIYIIGFSRGAIGTWDMVNRYPNFFTAAVPISCMSQSVSETNFRHTKIYAVSGDVGDDEAWYGEQMRGFVDKIKGVGGSAEYKLYSGASHETIQQRLNYSGIFGWLLNQ